MKNSIRAGASTAQPETPKVYTLSPDGKHLLYTVGSSIAYDIVDETADVYFVVFHQLAGLRKAFSAVNIMGKDSVAGAK